MSTQQLEGIPEGATVVLPPHGFVHLQASLADDLSVVNAARVSLAKQSDWEYGTDGQAELDQLLEWLKEKDGVEISTAFFAEHGRLSAADVGLIGYLLKGKHGTPFEHNFFRFHVRAPIFVFREWHRHRIGISINEESARYSPLQGDFYIPAAEDWREQHGKPGAYTYETMDPVRADHWTVELERQYGETYSLYEQMMAQGVAKEIARLCLPVGIYSQMLWSCNARSLMAFLTLRNAPTAQREICKYAQAMEAVFEQAMPVTHAAFVANGRVAP